MPVNRQGNSDFFNYSSLLNGSSLFKNLTGTQTYSQARQAAIATPEVVSTTESPPPNATAAPSTGSNNVFTGLCDALNQHQKKLEKQFPGYVADEYIINFAPASIGASSVVQPDLVYRNTAGKNTKTAQDVVDSSRDAVNTKSQNWNVLAGTQIVQFIDQVMRGSSYITGQQKINFNEDGTQSTNKTAGTSGVTAWYKISLTAQQLKYDLVRRDHAYRMIFTISPYAINQMASPYFPDSVYRGAHKAYNYWFTGANTQILNYEQEYNHAYYVTLTGNPETLAVAPPTGINQFKKTYMATSEVRGQGQANYVNEPGDSATSFLYSVSDFTEVRMQIVGDPAWMQQGEVAFGVNAQTFDFKPFNSDGGINYDSQEVVFTVSFSRPTDYNFSTGIVNNSGVPQQTFAYRAKSCKNVFSKGKFTQELVGSLITDFENNTNAVSTNGRTVAQPSNNTAVRSSTQSRDSEVDTTQRPSDLQSQADAQDLENGANAGTGTASTLPPSPQPAPPPKAPTSVGPLLDLTPLTSFGGVNLTTTPTLNPNATGQTLVPQPTKPQLSNRET